MREARYEEYCKQVRGVLKKATQKERLSLTEELMDHMESHAEELIELGWDPEDARDYAVQAMGDPEIVGRQYDEKLSSFWLWVGHVLRVIVVVFAIYIVCGTPSTYGEFLRTNLEARYITEPDWILASHEDLVWGNTQLLDIEIPLEKHTIRIYGVELACFSEDVYQARLYVTSYSNNPLDPRFPLWEYASVEGLYGSGGDAYFSSSFTSYFGNVYAGQETLTYQICREFPYMDIRVEIPLDWEDYYE